MSQIPSTSNVRLFSPRSVGSPDTALPGGGLGGASFGSVPNTPGLLSGLGAAGKSIGDATARFGMMQHRAKQQDRMYDFQTATIEADEAAIDAANKAPAAQAESVYHQTFGEAIDPVLDEFEDGDPLKNDAQALVRRRVALSTVEVRRSSTKRLADSNVAKAGVIIDATIKRATSATRAVGPAEKAAAVDSIENTIVGLEQSGSITEADGVIMRERVREQWISEQKRVDRGILHATAVTLIKSYGTATSDEARADVVDEMSGSITSAVENRAITPEEGVQLEQQFQKGAEAEITDQINSIRRRAYDVFQAGDGEALAGYKAQMMTMPEGEDRRDALVELDSLSKRMAASVGMISKLLEAYASGKITPGLPNDDQTLNQFYKSRLEMGDSPENVARFIGRQGLEAPPAMLTDIDAAFSAGGDVAKGAAVLSAVAESDPNRARKMALAVKKPDMATTALAMARQFRDDPAESERRLAILSDQRAGGAMETAGLHLRGDSLVKHKISPLRSIDQIVKYSGKPITESMIDANVLEAFDSEFLYTFTEQAVGANKTDAAEMTSAASTTAARGVAKQFVSLAGSGGMYMVPVDRALGVGSMARPGPMQPKLQAALDGFGARYESGWGWFSERQATVRPDLRVIDSQRAYFPALDDTGSPRAWLEWDAVEGKGKVIEPGRTPKETALWVSLTRALNGRVEPGDLGPNHRIQFRSEYGVRSVQGYEDRFGNGLADEIARSVEMDWLSVNGVPVDFSDEDQVKLYEQMLENKRISAGWPAWDEKKEKSAAE